MTNATKSLAIIFVVLSAITIGVKWASGPEASAAFRSDLVTVDTAQVNKMLVNHPTGDMITLTKEEDRWTISGSEKEQFPADRQRISSAINALNNLKVNAVATRNPDKFARYQVEDSTGTKVSFYDEDQLLTSVFVGASQRQDRRSFNSYIRPANQQTVYSVEGMLQSRFPKSIEDWRDKTVWDVSQEKITRVDFMYQADSSFSMTKTEDGSWISQGDTLAKSKVSTVLSDLSAPRSSGFSESLTKDNFGVESYAVQISVDNKKHQIQLKESPSDTTKYIGISQGSPYVFSFSKNNWDENILKSRRELLKGN